MRSYLRVSLIGLTSLFLLTGTAHAEELPLHQADQTIQQQKQEVATKTAVLEDTNQTLQELADKKAALSKQLEDEKKTVDSLSQQLAEKKAAAEAERQRLEAIKAMFVHINRFADNSAGNMYDFGNCTWYVKSRRPDIPNNWGNAANWYGAAASQGWSVGSSPKKGAIGVSFAGWAGHVVYVEGVSLDGSTVTISEMNYAGFNVISSRTVSASEFQYIYELN